MDSKMEVANERKSKSTKRKIIIEDVYSHKPGKMTVNPLLGKAPLIGYGHWPYE